MGCNFNLIIVQVHYEKSGLTETFPILEYRPLEASVKYCNSLVS